MQLGGERDADQLGGTQCVGPEQLAVREHVVDQRGGVDDQVDGVGQALPGLLIQAEVGFALVAGDDLEMVGGQLAVMPQQFGVAAVEGLVQPLAGRSVVFGPHQADHGAVRRGPSAPAIPGPGIVRGIRSPRQQDRAHLSARRGQAGRLQRRASMNLSSVRSRACTSVASRPWTVANVGRFDPGVRSVSMKSAIDCRSLAGLTITPTGTSTSKISRQQIAECQRRQRIPTEISEVRIGRQIAGRSAQQRAGGAGNGLQHRPVGTILAQCA